MQKQKITMYYKSDADWYDWLEEDVGEDLTRAKAIHIFVKNGLYPFIEKKGYRWGCTMEQLKNAIANGLYNNIGRRALESDWRGVGLDLDEGFKRKDTDLWHFQHVIGSKCWESFWRIWSTLWPDVDATTEYGVDRQIDIEEFSWTQIDVNQSKQSKVVDSIMYGEDNEEDRWGAGAAHGAGGMGKRREKEDVYIRDSAESNQWDGRRR